jgi:CheY-like chemotaxis protein
MPAPAGGVDLSLLPFAPRPGTVYTVAAPMAGAALVPPPAVAAAVLQAAGTGLASNPPPPPQHPVAQSSVGSRGGTSAGVAGSDDGVDVPPGPYGRGEVVWLRVAVADDGRGIPADKLEHLFKQYGQIAGVRPGGGHAASMAGTGLGLYLCREIVRRHGGHIGVASKPGRGATFTFDVPVRQLLPPGTLGVMGGGSVTAAGVVTEAAAGGAVATAAEGEEPEAVAIAVGGMGARALVTGVSQRALAAAAPPNGTGGQPQNPVPRSAGEGGLSARGRSGLHAVAATSVAGRSVGQSRRGVGMHDLTAGSATQQADVVPLPGSVDGGSGAQPGVTSAASRYAVSGGGGGGGGGVGSGDVDAAAAALLREAGVSNGKSAGDSDAGSRGLSTGLAASPPTSARRGGRAVGGESKRGGGGGGGPHAGWHILVVDDADTIRLLLRRGLQRGLPGCTVHLAGDGKEALEVYDRLAGSGRAPVAVCMDSNMPVMTGNEAVAALRSAPRGYGGLVVGITGNALAQDQAAFVACGCDAVLTKPVAMEALVPMVVAAGERRLRAGPGGGGDGDRGDASSGAGAAAR